MYLEKEAEYKATIERLSSQNKMLKEALAEEQHLRKTENEELKN